MNLRAKNKSKISVRLTPTCASVHKLTGGSKLARHLHGAPAPFLTPAMLPPRQRGSRAMRRRSIRFTMPTPWQFFLLDAPEIRRAFVFERRLLVVHAARALVDSGTCSLNAAARLLGIGASTLCCLIQRHKVGGDEALLPRFRPSGPATTCRLSFLVRTQ